MSTVFSVRANDEEKELIDTFASLYGKKSSSFIKDIVLNFIEDWGDVQDAEESHNKWILDNKKSYSHDEMKNKLGL